MNNPKLFSELEQRFNHDQKLSKNLGEEYVENCKTNSDWLEELVEHEGWIFPEQTNVQGEVYAWLIVQHSPNLAFQEKCLSLLKKLPASKERNQHIAFLQDRVLVRKGKKQLYGTQFQGKKPFPIINEDGLDLRRKDMSLGSFQEYYGLMQK